MVIKRQKVKSSHLDEVGYDLESKTLEVLFHNGDIWRYSPVSEEAKNALLNADSVGSYFTKNIKYNGDIKANKV